jgi:hypothetical protein
MWKNRTFLPTPHPDSEKRKRGGFPFQYLQAVDKTNGTYPRDWLHEELKENGEIPVG